LAKNATTGKLFQLKNLDVHVLADLNFDLASRMGELVTSANDLSKLEAVRTVYMAIAGDQEQLRNALSDRILWDLCQTRHLMVHRRGIADEKYIRDTGATLKPGAPLHVSPDTLESYVAAVVRAASAMLTAITGLLDAPPDTPLQLAGSAGG
jgi:hypothetical protein